MYEYNRCLTFLDRNLPCPHATYLVAPLCAIMQRKALRLMYNTYELVPVSNKTMKTQTMPGGKWNNNNAQTFSPLNIST